MECLLFRKVVGVDQHSILKMKEGSYAVKGKKSDMLGKGSYATVKNSQVHFSTKSPALFTVPANGLVIRSSNPVVPPRPDRGANIEKHNLDNSFARADRVKGAINRRYALHEKAECNLGAFLLKKQSPGGVYDDALVWKVALSVVREVYQFHQKGFSHRDIKAENFLVFPDGRIKLNDMDFIEENPRNKSTEYKGSLLAIPKRLLGVNYTNEQFDEFGLRRLLFCDLQNAFCYKMNTKLGRYVAGTFSINTIEIDPPLVSVFTNQFLQHCYTLRCILDSTNGAVSDRSIGELLCALLLEKNHLLYYLFHTQKLPQELVDILLEYQEKDPECVLLMDSDVAETIAALANKFIIDPGASDALHSHCALLREKLFKVDASDAIKTSSNSAILMPKPRMPTGETVNARVGSTPAAYA